MFFSSFISAFTFLLIISPSHPPPPTTFFVLLKMFINVSWSSQSNWKRGERMGLKGKDKTGRDFYKEDEKGLSTDWKEETKEKENKGQLMCQEKKKTKKGKTHVFSTLKLRKMVTVFLKEISLNLLRYIQFIFLMKSQKYKIETHRSLSF